MSLVINRDSIIKEVSRRKTHHPVGKPNNTPQKDSNSKTASVTFLLKHSYAHKKIINILNMEI